MPEKPPDKTHTVFSNQTPYLLLVTSYHNAVLFTVAKQEIKTNPNRGGSLAKLDSSAQLLSLPLPSTKQPDFRGIGDI